MSRVETIGRATLYLGDAREIGAWTVLSYSHSHRGSRHYLSKCVCGIERAVHGFALRAGKSESCGCLNRPKRRLPLHHAEISTILIQYKTNARRRGLEWGLTREDVECLIKRACHYCGKINGNRTRTRPHPDFWHNGIDRKDPAKGYFINNVVPCCGTCNLAKQSLTDIEFIERCICIADRWRFPTRAAA
jgi:hypothetical protein